MNAAPVSEQRWLVTSASVTGKAHAERNLVNQDCIRVGTSADGRIVAAVVSDGAGTASQADIGATTTCRLMLPQMLQIGQHLTIARGLGADVVRDAVAEGIEKVLQVLASDGLLRDRHCTMAACVITDGVGYVCQVGDSIGIATSFEERLNGSGPAVDFFPDEGVRLFEVERGEYANETHFITEPDWRSHLRVTGFPTERVDALMLMTDGAMDIAMLRGKVYRGFLSSVMGTLLATPERAQREALLQQWLADPRSWSMTGDDKTMFIAVRAAQRRLAGRPIEFGDPEAKEQVGTAKPLPLAGAPDPQSNARPLLPPSAGSERVERADPYRLMIVGGSSLVVAVAALGLSTEFLSRGVEPHIQETARLAALHPPVETLKALQASSAVAMVAPEPARAAEPPSPLADDVRMPPARPPELLLLPRTPPELVLRAGATADVTLQLVAGAEAQIRSVQVPPGVEFHIHQGELPCVPQNKLTTMSGRCVITVKAGLHARPGQHRLIVLLTDPRTQRELEVSLAVRLLKPGS
jgi:hypothetical protein